MKNFILSLGLSIALPSMVTAIEDSSIQDTIPYVNYNQNYPQFDWFSPQTGPTGPQGPVGPRGPKGEKGHKGEHGKKGKKGDRGPRGEPGRHGAHGHRGAPGPTGSTGATGFRGATGATGGTGATGPTGPAISIAGQFIYLQNTVNPITVASGAAVPFNTIGFDAGINVSPAQTNITTFTLPAGPNLYLVNYGIASNLAAAFVLQLNSVVVAGSLLAMDTTGTDTLVSTSVIFQTGNTASNLQVINFGPTPAAVGGTSGLLPFTAAYISIVKLN